MKSLIVLSLLTALSAYPLARADDDTRSNNSDSGAATATMKQQHGGGHPGGGGGHPGGGGGHPGGGHPGGGGGHPGGGHPGGGGGHPGGGHAGGGHGPGGFHGGHGEHGWPDDHDHIHSLGYGHQWHYDAHFAWRWNAAWYLSDWAWPFGIEWSSVNDVTCEAVNSAGQTFVASGVESTWGGVWDQNVVGQQVLQEALDECQASSGGLDCSPDFSDGFYNGCFLN